MRFAVWTVAFASVPWKIGDHLQAWNGLLLAVAQIAMMVRECNLLPYCNKRTGIPEDTWLAATHPASGILLDSLASTSLSRTYSNGK